MPLSPLEAELVSLQKFKRSQISLLRNGVRIEGLAGRPIEHLLREASSARFQLAKRFLHSARHLLGARPKLHRDAISRAYYAMYHAARAVAFLTNEGDDYEPHDKLASGLPKDFPDMENWQNELKIARLLRNE